MVRRDSRARVCQENQKHEAGTVDVEEGEVVGTKEQERGILGSQRAPHCPGGSGCVQEVKDGAGNLQRGLVRKSLGARQFKEIVFRRACSLGTRKQAMI